MCVCVCGCVCLWLCVYIRVYVCKREIEWTCVRAWGWMTWITKMLIFLSSLYTVSEILAFVSVIQRHISSCSAENSHFNWNTLQQGLNMKNFFCLWNMLLETGWWPDMSCVYIFVFSGVYVCIFVCMCVYVCVYMCLCMCV